MPKPPPEFWTSHAPPTAEPGCAGVTSWQVGGLWYMLMFCSMYPAHCASAEQSAAHAAEVDGQRGAPGGGGGPESSHRNVWTREPPAPVQ